MNRGHEVNFRNFVRNNFEVFTSSKPSFIVLIFERTESIESKTEEAITLAVSHHSVLHTPALLDQKLLHYLGLQTNSSEEMVLSHFLVSNLASYCIWLSVSKGRVSMDRYDLQGRGHMTNGLGWASTTARRLMFQHVYCLLTTADCASCYGVILQTTVAVCLRSLFGECLLGKKYYKGHFSGCWLYWKLHLWSDNVTRSLRWDSLLSFTKVFFTADILACLSRKSAGVTDKMALFCSSIAVSHDIVTVSQHVNTRTLKLRQLKGVQPALIYY